MYFPWWVVVVIRQQNGGPMHDQSSVHHAPTMPEGLLTQCREKEGWPAFLKSTT